MEPEAFGKKIKNLVLGDLIGVGQCSSIQETGAVVFLATFSHYSGLCCFGLHIHFIEIGSEKGERDFLHIFVRMDILQSFQEISRG